MATSINHSDADVLTIAKHQKAIIWLILLSISAYAANLIIPFLPTLNVGIISLITGGIDAYQSTS